MKRSSLLVLSAAASSVSGFMIHHQSAVTISKHKNRYTQLNIVHDTTKNKAAKMVSGEELETMLQEWDQPLVVDAYATW